MTGATSGIGRCLADLLRASGVDVIGLDLRAASGQPPVLSCDLGDPASIDAAVDGLPTVIDGLVNVAGVPGTEPDEVVFRVNFLGLRHLTEALLPRVRPGGSVVHVASTAGSQWATRLPALRVLLATPSFVDGLAWFNAQKLSGVPAYNLSKEAVCLYAMSSALLAVERGIRVNAVSPGPVRTPILPDFIASMGSGRLEWAERLAGRYAEPEDIAPVIAFLLTPAAAWINGTNLVADGGITGAVLSGRATPPAMAS